MPRTKSLALPSVTNPQGKCSLVSNGTSLLEGQKESSFSSKLTCSSLLGRLLHSLAHSRGLSKSGNVPLTRPHLLLGLCKVDLSKFQHQHVVPLLLDGHFVAKSLLIVPLCLIQDLVLGVGTQDWQFHTIVGGWGQKTKRHHIRGKTHKNCRDPTTARAISGAMLVTLPGEGATPSASGFKETRHKGQASESLMALRKKK